MEFNNNSDINSFIVFFITGLDIKLGPQVGVPEVLR